MNKNYFISLTALVLILLVSFTLAVTQENGDEAAIRMVIEKGYFNGAFNDLDTESMAKTFHGDFAIFSANGDKIAKYPIKAWIDGTNKRKKRPDFDPKSTKMDCKIVNLDITGGAAAAKIEISRDGKKVYTDYLSLLKFKSGWKISAKVYHDHRAR